MNSTNHSSTGNPNLNPQPSAAAKSEVSKEGPKPSLPPGIRTTCQEYTNPVDYEHPYDSMARFADFLALRYDANRTRHAYYRQVRLIQEHFTCDPTTLSEGQMREYFLFVKLKKHWQPKTIRQAVAAAKMFFIDLLGQPRRRSREVTQGRSERVINWLGGRERRVLHSKEAGVFPSRVVTGMPTE